MTKKIITDEQLMELIGKGLTANQICEKADVKLYTLKRRWASMMAVQKKYIDIPGIVQAKDECSFKATGVNIGKVILEESGFKSGDKFKINCNKKAITLTKM